MEFMLDCTRHEEKPFMDMSGIWLYNVEKPEFKSALVDTVSESSIRELLNLLHVESLSDIAVFMPPWKSTRQSGIKYDYLFRDLRSGQKVMDKIIAGARLSFCRYYNKPYVVFYRSSAAANPDFIAFAKGDQPSI